MNGTISLLANVFHREEPEFFVDWPEFWDQDHLIADWLFEPILARGRGHVFYAAQKTGKSLLLLSMAAHLATSSDPIAVVYLDYEMTGSDLYERLIDMGYGPDSDLRRLHYALLPTLPPLDDEAGAGALLGRLSCVEENWPGHHIVLIIDTTSRAVHGDENSADTIQSFYRFTGLRLKQRGITWVRADHSGKDAGKGPRGSSAKGDDVDVVWQITRTRNELQLRRYVARMNWVPSLVKLTIHDDPLRFDLIQDPVSDRAKQLVQTLDTLGVPKSASVVNARKCLEASGIKSGQEFLTQAVRYRKAMRSDVTPDVTPSS